MFGLERCGGEWMRGLGLGFTNPVGTRVVCVWCGLCCGRLGDVLGVSWTRV